MPGSVAGSSVHEGSLQGGASAAQQDTQAAAAERTPDLRLHIAHAEAAQPGSNVPGQHDDSAATNGGGGQDALTASKVGGGGAGSAPSNHPNTSYSRDPTPATHYAGPPPPAAGAPASTSSSSSYNNHNGNSNAYPHHVASSHQYYQPSHSRQHSGVSLQAHPSALASYPHPHSHSHHAPAHSYAQQPHSQSQSQSGHHHHQHHHHHNQQQQQHSQHSHYPASTSSTYPSHHSREREYEYERHSGQPHSSSRHHQHRQPEYEYEYEYDSRSARDYHQRAAPTGPSYYHEHDQADSHPVSTRSRDYARADQQLRAPSARHPSGRSYSPVPANQPLTAGKPSHPDEYEYEYSRGRMMDAGDEPPLSPRAPHAQQNSQAYTSRPSSTAPSLSHGRLPTNSSGASGRAVAAPASSHPPGSTSTTPSPRIQPSYYRGGNAGPGTVPPMAGSAGMSVPSGGNAGLPAPMFSPPRLGGARQSGTTSSSPRHGQILPPIQPSHRASYSSAQYSHHHGGPEHEGSKGRDDLPSAGSDGPGKSSMSIMSMLNTSGHAAPEERASIPPSGERASRLSSRREYEEQRYHRERVPSGYDHEYERALQHRNGMEEGGLPPPQHQHEVAAPMYAPSHAGASTHHSLREDAAAAALLSVAGGVRVDPPQSSIHPPTLPALVSSSAAGAGTSRSGTLPSTRSIVGISTSYANAPAVPGSMSSVEISRHHSGMQPPALPSISTGANLASSSRTASVEPGSSPVISTGATFSGGAAAPPRKTLKLKSKPLPSSAAKVSYAVAPPPPVTTPTESLANPLSASGKGGSSSKRKKGKDEHDMSISGAAGASSSGWDSDLESEANKALYKHPMLLYVDSVRARRAFLVDADRLHASARSDASWARLAGAYGKRQAYVLEGVRKRAEESKDGDVAGPSSSKMEAKGSAGSLNRSAKKAEAASTAAASPVAGPADAGKKKSSKKAAKPSADEDVSMALLSTLGGEDDEEEDEEEDEEMEEDGPDGDLELDLLLAATGRAKSEKSSKKDDDDAGADVADSSAAVKKAKARRKSRSKAAVAAEKAAKEAREYAIVNGLPLPPTPPPMNAPPRERGLKKSSDKDAAKQDRDAAATAGARSSAPPPSSPVAGSIAGLDESLANELLSTAVGGDGSDMDQDQNADEDEDDGEDDEDELEGSDAEERAILAAKRKKLAAAVMSSGKGKGKALVPSSAAQSSTSSSSGGKKRKRDLIDRHNLTGSASRAGSAAIAAALAADGSMGAAGGSSSRMQTPLRAMSTDFGGTPAGSESDDDGEDDSEELSAESEEEEDEAMVDDAEDDVEPAIPENPNKSLGVNSLASHPLWTRENGLVALEPSRINKLEEAHKKIWTQLARREIPRVYRTCQVSYNNKIQYWRRISIMAQREGKKGNQRTTKTVKNVQARARLVVREMLTFWKKNEKEERELRKKAEKEAMDKAKKEEEMREAKRQARKLNFLITQTELYSHFVGSKLKTSEAEESEETSGGAAAGALKEVPGAAVVTASTSKDVPLGPVDGATLEDIDFDDDDESNLRAHAARNAQQAIEDAKVKARAFDARAAEDRKKNQARLAADGNGSEDENGGETSQNGGKMIEEKDLGKAFDSDDMNFLNPTSMGAMDLKQPKMLTCQLKEYQLKGLNWLANLYEQGINGILADEMGLGKTVQSISLMAYLAEVHDIWGPFLVIAPASTLHNWQQEITRFVPSLKALPYWGSVKDRQVLRKFWNRKQIAYNRDSPFHVLVTSYQLVVTDEAHFRRVNWQYMVLDEAQAIKSSQSARWKTLLSFNCRNRLLLTGTPVQNSMQELWALLHFIMPSLFDSHDEFSEWFSKDIESHAENKGSALNEHQLRRLHMILKPFMLRRIKKNVQNELGDKIEIDIFCEMSARQKQLYRTLRTAVSAQDIIEQAALNESGLKHLMNLVMQFRKVCGHPELFQRADVSTPFAFAGSTQSGSIAREGDFLFLPDSTRSLIELEVPKLFYEDGGFFDVPAPQSRAGFDTKYLDNLFNIWRADHIQHSLLHQQGSAFSHLRLLDLSPADAEHVFRNPTIEKVLRAVEEERKWAEHEPFASDDDFAASGLRPFGRVRKAIPRVSELTPSVLMPLDGVATDYREYSVLAQPGARAIIPPAVAPPPELVASSRTIYDRQRGFKHDALVSLALYGLDPDARESEARVEQAQRLLPGSTPKGLLADSSADQLPASSMQIPQMNKFIVDSSKLARLDQLLRELKAGGHRCLIYFQMTRMIDLMEEYLIYRQYKYLRLDGASKISDRRDMVTDWQNNPELFIFLLSTRAGGLGINLTAADTVIFYDHDWNPSNDSQAMDRAHRLGQTKQVTVYRLITKSTIDERIVKLARNKKEVQDIVVGNKAYTESGMAKPQEIVSLLLDDDELAESILRRKQAEEAQTAEQKADMMRALHAKRRLLREKGGKEPSPAPVRDALAWSLDEDEDDFFGAKPSAPKADDDEEPAEASTSAPAGEAGNKKKKSGGGTNASSGGTKRKKPDGSGENSGSKPRSRSKAKGAAGKAGGDVSAGNGATNGADHGNGEVGGDGDETLASAPPKKRKKTDRRKKTADEIALPPADD